MGPSHGFAKMDVGSVEDGEIGIADYSTRLVNYIGHLEHGANLVTAAPTRNLLVVCPYMGRARTQLKNLERHKQEKLKTLMQIYHPPITSTTMCTSLMEMRAHTNLKIEMLKLIHNFNFNYKKKSRQGILIVSCTT